MKEELKQLEDIGIDKVFESKKTPELKQALRDVIALTSRLVEIQNHFDEPSKELAEYAERVLGFVSFTLPKAPYPNIIDRLKNNLWYCIDLYEDDGLWVRKIDQKNT